MMAVFPAVSGFPVSGTLNLEAAMDPGMDMTEEVIKFLGGTPRLT